ncbi:hypothetical protein [Achromobacter phage emuu_LB7]|nr:hypothetical protein [Achromobacter phage emuu_LB7]
MTVLNKQDAEWLLENVKYFPSDKAMMEVTLKSKVEIEMRGGKGLLMVKVKLTMNEDYPVVINSMNRPDHVLEKFMNHEDFARAYEINMEEL